MTRPELIALLQFLGFIAHAHDWVMGETVWVTHESLRTAREPIEGFSDATHLRDNHDGTWTLTQPDGSDLDLLSFAAVLRELDRRLKHA